MKISGKTIGKGNPCFIIAEAGSNHNGDLNQAKALIDVAADADADAVKFQIFSAKTIYSKKTPMPSYMLENELADKKETLWDIMKDNELPRDWIPILMDYCRQRNILFLATPFDIPAVDECEKFGMEAFKVASFEITYLPMLKRISATGKPIILSTGMANILDIETALAAIKDGGTSETALLHCAIAYPPKDSNVNLRAMDTMRRLFGLEVGFSDHTMNYIADVAAVAMGASIIEKHFTLSRKLEGPDHPFSLEPDELKAMVSAIRETEELLGSPVKIASEAEGELHGLARRGLVAATDIPSGTVITSEMLAVKRPAYGVHPKYTDIIVGRTAKCDIEEDDIFLWEMV